MQQKYLGSYNLQNVYIIVMSELYDPDYSLIDNFLTSDEVKSLRINYDVIFLTFGIDELKDYNRKVLDFTFNSFKPLYLIGYTDNDIIKLNKLVEFYVNTSNADSANKHMILEDCKKSWRMIRQAKNKDEIVNLYNDLGIKFKELYF